MTIVLILVAIAIILTIEHVWSRRARNGRPIGPARALQQKYGLYAENRPQIRLDPERVPRPFRHLVPLAEKWGIGNDIIRNDCVDKASEAEKLELHDALYEPYEQITAWLNSFGTKPMPDEAAAFMYMQEALDEMGYFILDEKRGSDR